MEKILYRNQTDEVKEIIKGIKDSFPDVEKDQEVTKTGFSPSALVWGDGACFSAETEFVTKDGIKKLGDCVGENVLVWTGGPNGKSKNWQGHGWKSATVEYFGEQEIYELTVTRRGVKEVIRTTKDHRWLAVTNEKYQHKNKRFNPEIILTEDLVAGDVLWTNPTKPTSATLSPDGIRHGFVFGDGNAPSKETTTAQFFGQKDQALIKYFGGYNISEAVVRDIGNNVPYRRAYGLPAHYKKAPARECGIPYLYGFLAGYFAADGSISNKGAPAISSARMQDMKLVQSICAILNIGTGSIYTGNRLGINGVYSDIHTITLYRKDLNEDFFLIDSHKRAYKELEEATIIRPVQSNWRVESVVPTGVLEDVYCVVEPETESFTLANGIVTKNCARRWHLLFRGANWKSTDEAKAIDRMNSGTDRHERLQEKLMAGPLDVSVEDNLRMTDPPLNSYCDVVIHQDGKDIPVEIKTVSSDAFAFRQTSLKVAPYHLTQLLIYMEILQSDIGFIFYENRDTFEKLVIPVKMTDEYRDYLSYLFNWMETVYSEHERGEIAREFKGKRKNSKICKGCPVKEDCESNKFPGTVDLPLLKRIDQ